MFRWTDVAWVGTAVLLFVLPYLRYRVNAVRLSTNVAPYIQTQIFGAASLITNVASTF